MIINLVKNVENNTNSVTLTEEVSSELLVVLSKIEERGWWEFRDYSQKEYCREGILRSDDCDELLSLGLLDNGDGMSWHQTYYITELGKKVIEVWKG